MTATPGVLDVLRARAAGVPDDHVVALTVEGGGMRGVVSGAMLIALRDLGIAPLFDRLYGTSSGSINVTYFASGAGWDALSVYYDHLTGGFVRLPPLPGRPLLDMKRVERVFRTDVPFDAQALSTSPYDARILLTDVAGREPVVVDVRAVGDRVAEHLLAGAWLPLLAGKPFTMDGRAWLDGGLLWPDPLYAALAEGCTHVLALNTASVGSTSRTSWGVVRLLCRNLDRWSPGLADAYLAGRAQWEADRPQLVPGREVELRGTCVLRLQPPARSHRVLRLTTDRGALLDGARAGYAAVCSTFGRPLPRPVFSVVGR